VRHDLRRLVQAARLRGPLVLAGHSTGGLSVRQYAGRYPNDAVGPVLVDAISEELAPLMGDLWPD